MSVGYRPDIDGLRAIAVLVVLFFHAGINGFEGGYVGVDVFFVISGYLISTLIIKDLINGSFSFLDFYERRARRLLPALCAVLAVTTVLSTLILPPNQLKDFGQSLVAVVFYASNFLFWYESGYFATASEIKPLLHTWSLGVEEQFYLFFPILMMALWRLKSPALALNLIIGFFVFSLSYAHIVVSASPAEAFYLIPARAWELFAGVILAVFMHSRRQCFSIVTNNILGTSGLFLIFYATYQFDKNTPFPSLYALVPVLGSVMVILSDDTKTWHYRLLTNKIMIRIGLISYSLYLVHQPIFAFVRNFESVDLSKPTSFLLIIVCLLLAHLCWRYIETPLRKEMFFSGRRIFVLLFASTAVFSFIGGYLHLSNGLASYVGFTPKLLNTFERPKFDSCFGIEGSHYRDVWGCRLGQEDTKPQFVLFGDSHSLSFTQLADEIGRSNGFGGFYAGAPGCPPLLGVYVERNDQNAINCNLLNQRISNYIIENEIKAVVLVARWAFYGKGDYDGEEKQYISDLPILNAERLPSQGSFERLFNQTVDFYTKNGVEVVLITQVPHQKIDPQAGYYNFFRWGIPLQESSVSTADFSYLSQSDRTLFDQRDSDIAIVDSTMIMCSSGHCPIGTESGSYYFDDDHLSAFGAIMFRRSMEHELVSALDR